jgi:hypothetical protein
VTVAPARPPAMLFTTFCREVGVTLEKGQLVLAKVAYDGVEPCELQGEERELARLIFGPSVERIPPLARRVIVLVIGARSGKSRVFIALRMLHLAVTVPLDALNDSGEKAAVNITAPDLDLAEQDLAFIRGAIQKHPRLRAMAVHGAEPDSKSDHIILRRSDGDVIIKTRAASGKGKTGRGRSILGFGLDEAAFFQDANHKVNDRDIFEAQETRIVPGGQGVVASTPWAEDGLLFEKYERNWDNPVDCLVAHAPTALMRVDALILEMVRIAYADPTKKENAEREFGARFVKTHAMQFFDGATLDAVFVDEPLPEVQVGDQVTAGGDLGFIRNSSAVAVALLRAEHYQLAELEERKPEGEPLKPSVVCKDFAGIIRRRQGKTVMSDNHARASALEAFEAEAIEAHGEQIAILEAPDPSETFVNVRTKMREGKVRVSKHHPLAERLRTQLKAVRSRALAGGKLSISMPQAADGSHCDLVPATVLAFYQDHGTVIESAAPKPGTTAYDLERERRSVERLEERLTREEAAPWWGGGGGGDTSWLNT